jgi:hypothetical protein
MRENADAKGRRYIVDGRLVVERVDYTHKRFPIVASCRGSGQTYRLGFDLQDGWRCNCEARGHCAHLVALQLVTNLDGLK